MTKRIEGLKKILFKGNKYWLVPSIAGYTIAPLEHFNKDGTKFIGNRKTVGYAILFNHKIYRHDEMIGTEEEITYLDTMGAEGNA